MWRVIVLCGIRIRHRPHHSRIHVVEVMTVEGPGAGVAGVELDGDGLHRRHQHRVAERPVDAFAGAHAEQRLVHRRLAVEPKPAVDPRDPGTWGKVGRNESCPCGSGKKFKHCHGAFV